MGFLLTILYVVLTIISPAQFGQEFASYHPMVYLAALTAIASLPEIFALLNSRPAVQIQLTMLFLIAIVVSQLHNGRLAATASLLAVLPNVAVFFFVVGNVNTLRRLKIIISIIVATCLGLTIEALCGYYGGFRDDMFVLLQFGQIRRLRAAGFLNDPNDLAQFILIVLPLVFVAWNRRRIALKSLIVIPAAAFLAWAAYLTHSRGALIALGVLLLAAFHKKIGTVPSVILAGLFVFGMLSLDFTGGRGISAADGIDRLELWSEGLQYFKRAPIVGIGFGEFADSDFSGITAHNSFVLCLAELGIVGSTIFVGMLVTTLMGLNKIIDSEIPSLAEPIVENSLEPEEQVVFAESYPIGGGVETATEIETAVDTIGDLATDIETDKGAIELKRYAIGMRLAFISFIATSCFLSRSYTPTMFLTLGLATATISLEPEAISLSELRYQMLVTCAVEVLTIVAIYGVVRLRA